jgi:hypothetical protein
MPEYGTISVDEEIYTVTFSRTFVNPVVIIGALSEEGGDPSTTRVSNVTPDSFDVQVIEWDYKDGNHAFESIGYLVVEAGHHVMGDGTEYDA